MVKRPANTTMKALGCYTTAIVNMVETTPERIELKQTLTARTLGTRE